MYRYRSVVFATTDRGVFATSGVFSTSVVSATTGRLREGGVYSRFTVPLALFYQANFWRFKILKRLNNHLPANFRITNYCWYRRKTLPFLILPENQI